MGNTEEMTQRTANHAPKAGTGSRQFSPTLWPLHFAAFLATFVFALANVAAPDIRTTLDADSVQLSLIVSAFAASFAAAIVVCGRLGDRFGRRRMFIGGMIALVITSVMVALSWNGASAVIVRTMQGVSAAAMMPQILALIQSNTTGSARARAISTFAAFSGVGTVAGQVLGGGIISLGGTELGWRSAFIVFALAAAVAAWAGRSLPMHAGEPGLRIDVAGALLLGVTIACFVTGLSLGPYEGWSVRSLSLLGLAVVFAVGFLVHQRYREIMSVSQPNSPVPLLGPTVLKNPAIFVGMIMAFAYFGGYGAFLYNFAQLTQIRLGQPAWESGVALAPFCLIFLLVSLVCHRITARIGGPATLLIGAGAQAIGLAGITMVTLAPLEAWELWVQVPMVPLAVGQALQFSPLVATVMAAVPGRLAGMTGGLISTMQQAGIAAGVAGLGAFYSLLATASDPIESFGVLSSAQIGLSFVFAVCALVLVRVNRGSGSHLAGAGSVESAR
jgi:predicted MFS family arabinose efflux permease